MKDRPMKSRLSRFGGRLLYILAAPLPRSEARPFGRLGKVLRRAAAKQILSFCGKDVNIEKGARFASDIALGDRSALGIRAEIGEGTILGRDVMMGPDCLILTKNHRFDRTHVPMNTQGETLSPVVIGNDVWIGARVTILPGARIGDGAVIGAGSVVSGEISAKTVVAGNPARPIHNRDEHE